MRIHLWKKRAGSMALVAMLFLSVALTGCTGRNIDVPEESESSSVETPAATTQAEETSAETVSGICLLYTSRCV